MRGYLRKRVQQNKLFQRSKHPKRYFAINFQLGTINVYHTEENYKKKDPDSIEILFRDVQRLLTFGKAAEQQYEVASKNFRSPFIVQTTQRKFELFASSEEERKMWIAGFQYILVSTSEVQILM